MRPDGPRPTADNVVRLPGQNGDRPAADAAVPPADRWKGIAEPGTPVAAGLDDIARSEPTFDAAGLRRGRARPPTR